MLQGRPLCRSHRHAEKQTYLRARVFQLIRCLRECAVFYSLLMFRFIIFNSETVRSSRKHVLHCTCESIFVVDSEDECALTVSGENLRCVPLLECEGAKKLLHENETPRNCGFNGNEPKVCCSGYPEERTKKPGDLARDGM